MYGGNETTNQPRTSFQYQALPIFFPDKEVLIGIHGFNQCKPAERNYLDGN